MTEKPTYEELETRIQELEQTESNRKRIEEQLSHSSDLMEYVISNARSAIAIHDRDLKYIYVSKRYLKDYKVQEKNVIGRHHYEVFPDLPQKWRDVHQRSLAGEVLSAEEDPYHREDGSIDWTHWECRPWYESNGSIGGIIIYTEVINERKKVEESLRESEHRLLTHLQNTPIGAIAWDLDFKVIEWNPAVENIFGYSKAQAIGKHAAQLILPENMKELVDGVFQDLLMEKGGIRSTNENITKDGRRIICDWYNTALKDFKGKVIGVASLVHDITERLQTYEALKEQKEFNEKIVQTSSAIIIGLDKNHRITLFNKGAEKITGFNANEVIGRDWFKIFFKPDIYDEMDKVWIRAWGAEFDSYVNPIQTKNGDEKIISWQSTGMYDSADETKHMLFSIGEDITNRVLAEEALKESEKKYRRITENAKDMIYRMSLPDGHYEYVSPASLDLFGYPPEKFYESPVLIQKIIHPDWIDYFKEEWKKLVNGNMPPFYEYQIIHKSGEQKWLNQRNVLICDDNGQAKAIEGIVTDVTQRKKIERALKESEEKYRTLAEECPISIMTFNHKGMVTFVNKWHLKTFAKLKHGPEFFIGKKITELPGLVSAKVIPDLEKVLQGKYVVLEDVYFPEFTGGHSGYQSIKAVPTYKKKEVVGGILIREDVTKRKHAENALRESEEKYRSMMESMKDASYICSSDLHIEYMNTAMINRTGADATGELCYKAIYDMDKKCSWCVFDKIKKGDHVDYEVADPKDNHYYSVTNSLISHSNGTISKLTIFHDITQIKNIEAQLQQAQKMESIGTLAGGIAHDFNNILFPIVGYTEMLLADVPEDSPLREGLKEIYTSSLRARSLVKQILTFSHQDNTDLILMKIQPIAKEALKLIRSTIPTTIEIQQDINPDCGVIKADPTQIHQIVMNLATNAYHAMEDTGGELKVSLKEVDLGALDLINPNMAPGIYACLTVADTGVGMDKTVTDKIFDPFFTTKAIGKGTGLGLSVVHGIVTAIGGAIHVYSEPGKGTQFHVYLPVKKNLFEEQVSSSKTKIQGGTEQILLVDDEEAILTMEKRMLERLGYQVTSRTSSLEALEAFRDSPDKFDLVITDMAMPNMSGDRLSVELTKIRPGISILLCTGFSKNMPEERAASLGIKGFLFKPIVMKDFAQKIREVLE